MTSRWVVLAFLFGARAIAQTEPGPLPPVVASPAPVAPAPPETPTPAASPTPTPVALPLATPETTATPTPTPAPALISDEGIIPRLNLYLPEGRAQFRLSRLLKSSLFETEFEYDFVSGDLAAALRYRYYGVRQIFTLTGFDQLRFRSLDTFSLDYDRIRGVNALIRRPFGFQSRFLFLTEMDRITSLTPGNPDNRKTNVFFKAAYQFGSSEDPRSNQLGGDPTDRVRNLFTVARDIGPNGRVVTLALTYGTPVGNFDYVKAEGEAVQILDFPGNKRIVGRVHAGFFPYKKYGSPTDTAGLTPYRIPNYELFQLDGRDALKGSKNGDRDVSEIHFTLEGFYPIFVNQSEQFLKVNWSTLYLVGYAGTGNLGRAAPVYTRLRDYQQDAGLGFEASFTYWRYKVFISALVARVFQQSGSPKFLLTLRSFN